jgi:hypothetical protein
VLAAGSATKRALCCQPLRRAADPCSVRATLALPTAGLALLGACSGDPFTLAPEALDGGATEPPDAAEPAEAEAPEALRSRPMSAPAAATPPDAERVEAPLGFAATAAGELAAFETTSGALRGSATLPGVVEDAIWDARTRRVIASVREPEVDGGRVLALGWNGAFAVEAVSEPLTGSVRAFPLPDALVVATEEIGTSWLRLTDALSPLGASHSGARPAGVAPLAGAAALVLDPWAGGADADRLLTIDFAATPWTSASSDVPAPGRPSARIVSAGSAGVWLVRLAAPERVDLAAVATAGGTHVTPSFRSLTLPGADGTLESIVWLPGVQSFAATLARGPGGASPGALLLLPLAPGAAPALAELPAAVETSTWPAHGVVIANERLLVATLGGVSAWRIEGTPLAPALHAIGELLAAGLRAPLGQLE